MNPSGNRAKKEAEAMKYTSAALMEYRGKWRGQLKYKDDSGKWHSTTKMLKSKGKRDAQRELEAWRDDMEREAAAVAGELGEETVSDYLEAYIAGKEVDIERSSFLEYKRIAKNQIGPYIGSQSLDALTPDEVRAWVVELSKEYAPVTVRKALVLLRSAMNQAVECDRLAKNPTRTVKPPKKAAPKPNALDERGRAQLIQMLDVAPVTPELLGVRIALYTGMREGEICALRWKNVDIAGRSLKVAEALGSAKGDYYIKDPKNEGSRRELFFGDELASALSARLEAVRAKCFAAGVPYSEDFFVLGEVDGSFLPPRALTIKWKELSTALGLIGTQGKRPTFHDLRHTYATAAIANGIDVKTVSSALGHANAAMTLNTYASADPDAKKRAAATMSAAFAAETERAKRGNVIRLDKTGTDY